MIPTSQVSTFEIMGFFYLSKPVIMLSFLCLVSWNQLTEAVGYFECTDTATGTRYESSTKITTDFESSNKTISSVPMLTNTTAGYTQFESTNREVAEVGSSPLTEASITVSANSTETGTTCSHTSSQVVASSTSVISDLSTEFEGQTETEGESSTTKQETTEAGSTEHTASSTTFDSTEKLTSMLTTEFETTTKVTTLEKTTESETTKATTPRETTAAAKCCTDCHQLYQEGYTADGIYEITPSQWPGLPFDVYCKEGWTVIQRRIDGSVDFIRNWDDYKEGFGSPDYELWLGNEKLFHLTNQTTYELHIDLIMSDDTSKYLNYKLFRVDDEGNNYKLTLGDYTGNAGKDFMGYHNNQFFTTFDRDNDLSANENCAISHDAGWWFNFCYAANLNGDYHDPGIDGICVVDRDNFQYQCGIKYCQMKARPLI